MIRASALQDQPPGDWPGRLQGPRHRRPADPVRRHRRAARRDPQPGRTRAPRAGGTTTPTSCRTGSRPTSGSKRPRPASVPTRSSSSPACCRPRTTPGRSPCSATPTRRDEIERRVGPADGRQAVLTGPHPPHLWAVLDEAVLRRSDRPPWRDARPARAPDRRSPSGRTSPSRSSRSSPAATPRPGDRSASCGSPSATCPTWSTSSSSPARCTWTSGRPSTTTWR